MYQLQFQTDAADPPEDITISTSSSSTDVGASYTIKEGDDLKLDCEAQGAMPAEVTYQWTRSGDSFTQESDRLRINSINRDDAGTYTCSAINQMTPTDTATETGAETRSVQVIVQCEYMLVWLIL